MSEEYPGEVTIRRTDNAADVACEALDRCPEPVAFALCLVVDDYIASDDVTVCAHPRGMGSGPDEQRAVPQ
jgi:hypothetical protein